MLLYLHANHPPNLAKWKSTCKGIWGQGGLQCYLNILNIRNFRQNCHDIVFALNMFLVCSFLEHQVCLSITLT